MIYKDFLFYASSKIRNNNTNNKTTESENISNLYKEGINTNKNMYILQELDFSFILYIENQLTELKL